MAVIVVAMNQMKKKRNRKCIYKRGKSEHKSAATNHETMIFSVTWSPNHGHWGLDKRVKNLRGPSHAHAFDSKTVAEQIGA